MGLAEGIQAGLQLRDYVENNAQKQEQAKLQAQLFKSQADHLDAQNQLIHMQVQQHATMQGLMQQEQGRGQLSDYLTQNPEQAQAPSYEQEPGMVGPPRLQSAMNNPAMAGMLNLKATLDTIPPKPLDMMTLAGLAGNAGLHKEAAAYQQGAVEQQNMQLKIRGELLQTKLGTLIKELGSIPEGDPTSAGKRMQKQFEIAQVMGELGKTNDAIKLFKSDITALQPGAELTQTFPGGSTQVLRTNPNRPIVVGEGGQAFAPPTTPGGQAQPITPQPTSPEVRAEQRGRGSQRGHNQANAEPLPGTDAVPPGQVRYNTTVDGQAVSVDAWSEPHAQQILQSAHPGRTFQLTPAPVPKGAAAQLAGDKERAMLEAKTGKPGATQADVTTGNVQATQNVQAGKPGATVEDVQAARTAGEGLPVEVQTKLSSINAADHYRQKLTEFSDAEIDKYVGLLRGKKADIDNLMANIKDASKGDPRRYEFLSLVNQIYYETNRPDVGANFTIGEKDLVGQIYANGGERSSSEFKGKLSRLQDILATKKGTIEKAATTTRGELKRSDAATKGPTPGAAPGQKPVKDMSTEDLLKEFGKGR